MVSRRGLAAIQWSACQLLLRESTARGLTPAACLGRRHGARSLAATRETGARRSSKVGMHLPLLPATYAIDLLRDIMLLGLPEDQWSFLAPAGMAGIVKISRVLWSADAW